MVDRIGLRPPSAWWQAMARKPISKEFWIWQLNSLNVGALAAGSSVTTSTMLDGSRLQGARVKKIRYSMEWRGKTIDDGPAIWGLSWGLTQAQIAATMDTDPQSSNEVDMEQAERNIYPIGVIPRKSTQTGEDADAGFYMASKPLRTANVPSYDLVEGITLSLFVHNPVGAVAFTTGTVVSWLIGYLMGWLSD